MLMTVHIEISHEINSIKQNKPKFFYAGMICNYSTINIATLTQERRISKSGCIEIDH